jgi:hypothetical protein
LASQQEGEVVAKEESEEGQAREEQESNGEDIISEGFGCKDNFDDTSFTGVSGNEGAAGKEHDQNNLAKELYEEAEAEGEEESKANEEQNNKMSMKMRRSWKKNKNFRKALPM